jgi:hypothetical protein
MSKCTDCGKDVIDEDGIHLGACDGPSESIPPTEEKATSDPVEVIKPEAVDPDEIDNVKKMICPRCGAIATRFDNFNWMCPKDGTYDAKAPIG